MAQRVFNVNADAVIALSARLERLNRSAFPSAVRSTLNDGAFAMKKTNILESARKNMNVKSPMFFKKYTGVRRATGFKIEMMSAEVGFTDKHVDKAQKAVNYGMEANEVGATDQTGLKYYPATRGSRGMVKRSMYFDKNNVDDDQSGNTVKRVFRAKKKGKHLFINTSKGKALIKVKSIKKGANGRIKINSQLLMMDRTQKKAKAKATHFNKEAAIKTSKSMDDYYLKNATYQFNKALRTR